MIKTRDFLGAKTKMKSLISIVNEYDYEDISKAIYCVCVCVNNRSVLESTLSLNWALAEHSHKGNKKIENYDDFKSFFRSIESIIKPSDYDDAYVEDYGEVFIEVFGKKYSVIVGTGHNMVFACLQFLPILACELNKKDELIKVMTYNSFIIDFLKESNIKDGKYGARLVLPSEALFIKVSELFDNLDINTLKSVDNILKSDYIEKKHFIETERGITPLANTSLLMDLYDLWYKSIPDKAKLVDRMLTGVAYNLSKLETDETINFLCPVGFSNSREKPNFEYQFPFVLVSSKAIIFAVNKDDYSNGELKKVINEIISAKNKDSLFLFELYSRSKDGKCRGITVLKCSDIKFMIYDAWANPSEKHILTRTGDEKYYYCTALDIVYYILFMDDIDELLDYFYFIKGENNSQILGHGGDASTFLAWKNADHVFEKGAIKYSLINVGFDTENEYVVDYYCKKLKDFPLGRGDYILDNPFSWKITPKENGFYEYVQKGKAGFGGLYRIFQNNCYFFFPHNVKFYPDINEYLKYKDEIMIHRKRYNSFGDMKDEVRAKVSQDIIKQREEAKHDLRTVSYLLETTLFNSRRGHVILSAENYQYLLAYANWLVVLSDNADMCYFTDDEVYIKVSGEYIIDVESNRESDQTLGEELAKRMYDNPGRFERDRSADEKFFEKIKQAFARDTGVPLEVFLKLMFYLETGGNIGSELYHRANTLCFWKEDIIDDYCSVQNVSKKLAEKALQLLSINPKRLKTKNNKTDFYLPIGDKEKRCDRYEVNPVYEYDDMIIYSPVAIHFLRDYWENSLFEFCMPYEIGLPSTKNVVTDWKRVYEKKIVFDLENVFKDNGFIVRSNFELKNLDKKKYPQYLGDYDLFAVNLQAKEIWIIECKVIEKVETFYEMYRQQNRFFKENKYDEKFQRRIDFLNANYAEVIRDLKLPIEKYNIKPYMCVNKVFVSRYKKITFPILSYQEMVAEIGKENRLLLSNEVL